LLLSPHIKTRLSRPRSSWQRQRPNDRSVFVGKSNKFFRHVLGAKPRAHVPHFPRLLKLVPMMRGPPHYDAATPEACFSGCTFFRCSQGHFSARDDIGWCRLVDDECTPQTCKFTQCSKGKLLSNGVCGYTVKPKTVMVKPQQELKPIRAPPKLAQRIKERELF